MLLEIVSTSGPGQESSGIPGEKLIGTRPRWRHLCVVCALRKHDFEERAPGQELEACDAVPLARAWIDGLPYRSAYHAASRGITCTDCGDRVLMTYDPELALEEPLALYAL